MPGGLTVVIPHHSRRDLLAVAMAAVAGQPVIVVDDGPAGSGLGEGGEEDPLLRRLLDAVEVLRTSGCEGFARAANLGLSQAAARGASRVLILNDDAAPDAGCVALLDAALVAGVGAVGPLLVDPSGGVESAGLLIGRLGRVRQRRAGPGGPVDALSGACLLLRADARFDPRYRHGFEDLGLCVDLRRRGLEVRLVAGARCVHLGGATVPRHSADAQRHAVSGHLRLVGGGWRAPLVLGLAVAQVLREGGPVARLAGIGQGWSDWRAAGEAG